MINLSVSDSTVGLLLGTSATAGKGSKVLFGFQRGYQLCNCDYPGGPQLDHISVGTTDAILDRLKNSPSHKIAISLYIGLHGRSSLKRQRSLKVQVLYLYRWLSIQGIPVSQDVALNITTSRDKVELSSDLCHSDLGDKWTTYQSVESRGVDAVLFDSRYYPRTETVDSVSEYFTIGSKPVQSLARSTGRSSPCLRLTPLWIAERGPLRTLQAISGYGVFWAF